MTCFGFNIEKNNQKNRETDNIKKDLNQFNTRFEKITSLENGRGNNLRRWLEFYLRRLTFKKPLQYLSLWLF